MRGLLADVNVQRHALVLLRGILERSSIDLWNLLTESGLRFSSLVETGLSNSINDEALWKFCQEDGWVLFTDNRNAEEEKSLEVTLQNLWHLGDIPVVTVSDKTKLETNSEYAEQVAFDLAELLFGIEQGEYRDRPRIYVPLS
jgi:hypothetical protein